MHADLGEILFSEAQLAERVGEMAAQISRDYEGKNPLCVGILKGSFVYLADLVRAMSIDCSIDFLSCSSYGKSSKSTGQVRIVKDFDSDIEGRDVIIVEDILDTGATLSYIMEMLKARKVASVKLAVLLDTPSRRTHNISADYVGFAIPDAFVVGYGLDYAEKYRSLPYIGVVATV